MAATDTSNNSEWIQWLNFLGNLQQQQQKPKWRTPPMGPEQREVFDYALGRLKSLPDVSKALAPYAIAKASQSNPLDINALKAGKVGYTPTGNTDLSGLIHSISGGQTDTTPPPPKSTPPPTDHDGTGVPGDPFGHITAPSPHDPPNAAPPPGQTPPPGGGDQSSPTGGSGLFDLYNKGKQYIDAHPDMFAKGAGMGLSALITLLGGGALAGAAAGKALQFLLGRYIQSKQGPSIGNQNNIPIGDNQWGDTQVPVDKGDVSTSDDPSYRAFDPGFEPLTPGATMPDPKYKGSQQEWSDVLTGLPSGGGASNQRSDMTDYSPYGQQDFNNITGSSSRGDAARAIASSIQGGQEGSAPEMVWNPNKHGGNYAGGRKTL